MDEMTLLRKVRDEVHAEEAALERGRDDLIHHIGSRRPRRRALRRIGFIGIPTLIAAGVAVALVATNVVGVGSYRGDSQPAAAEVLGDAAVMALKASDPKVGPGQYLKVATTFVVVTSYTSAANSEFLTQGQEDLYIPADQTQEWVRVEHPMSIYKTFGRVSKTAADDFVRTGGLTPSQTDVVRSANGGYFFLDRVQLEDFYSTLPTDPQELLDYARTNATEHAQTSDSGAFLWIADQLTSPFIPAAVRANLYRAAALIPGITVVDRRANLEGRRGVAIGYALSGDYSLELIVDPRTGQFIGHRQVVTSKDQGLPEGAVSRFSAVTTSVVDSAPAGGVVCNASADDTAADPNCPS